jgi:hypothetical protein
MRQDLHLRSLGPKPSVLLLHYALRTPDDEFENVGVEKRVAENPGHRRRGEIAERSANRARSTLALN